MLKKVRTTLALAALLCVPLMACGGDDNSVPSNAYCDPVSSWPSDRVTFETTMLDLFNQARAVGATCGGDYYDPAGSLSMEPSLRCASRVHSMDMHDRQFFAHDNPDGLSPWDRFALAGWEHGGGGENIIGGYGSPQAAFDGWMASPGHCANIMNPSFNRVGIGWFIGPNGYGDYGTAGFGRE